MPVKSDVISLLQNDFSKKVADEILSMIDKLRSEGMSAESIEDQVTGHYLHLLQQDVNAAVVETLGGTKVTNPTTVRPASRAKSKK
jgi:hypothetical protein